MNSINYEGSVVIDGVHVNFRITGQPVGALPAPSYTDRGSGGVTSNATYSLGLVRQATPADAREIVSIIANAVDETIYCLTHPEPDGQVGQGCIGCGGPLDTLTTLQEVADLLAQQSGNDGYWDHERGLVVFPIIEPLAS